MTQNQRDLITNRTSDILTPLLQKTAKKFITPTYTELLTDIDDTTLSLIALKLSTASTAQNSYSLNKQAALKKYSVLNPLIISKIDHEALYSKLFDIANRKFQNGKMFTELKLDEIMKT